MVTTAPPRARRGRLFRKYVILFVALVSGALLTSGLLELYFSSEENRAALVAVQREKAAGASSKIEQFIREIERLLGGAVQAPVVATSVTPEQRRNDLLRLLRQAPAITEISYLDGTGREQERVSRLAMNVAQSGADLSREPKFVEARARKIYYGPVYFRNESEPYMTISMAEGGPSGGVTAAEVNLKFIWDVVSRIQIGQAGRAYVVDARGQLIAHPDISLVLQKTDLSGLPQFQAARSAPALPGQAREAGEGRDLAGRAVLAAFDTIDPPGWSVFVEQPLDEALAPLYASLLRTVLLLLVGLALSLTTGLFLARRMVTPIRALQAGAARIGAGALDQQIEVNTGDELEELAQQFNSMTAQLRESYATLEQKVEERTRDLAEAMAQLEEKSRQLEVASRHKSEFLANMSHELRTPLNAIIGFSEVLTEQIFGELNERQEEYLNDILTSGRHLLSLINDILDLSKVEAGRMELDLEEFSLREALENGLTMVKERAGRHGIQLVLELDPELDVIEADERKVKQVVFNLLSNAVKFTPEGGRIEVSARLAEAGRAVVVAVRDSGIGIAPEDQERIFEEFRQAGQASVKAHEGTGLGLALTRKFVELHGGRIWVESEVGVGSTFSFTLPLRTGEAAEPPTDGRASEDDQSALVATNGSAAEPTVLLVEDDQRAVELLTLYLRGAGYHVEVARDGEQGLELARQLRPDGITLDVRLPKLDGWEFLTRAKSDPTIADIPVVIVSMVDERGKGLALGAAEYLVKPVRRDELLSTLRRFTPRRNGSPEPPTVLVIDDDPMAIDLVEAILQPRGYTVLAARGGEDGVAMAKRSRPTLIVLDLMMPEVDGFEVVERLRADPDTASIPIVILTSKSMTTEDRERLNGRISYLARKGEFDRAAFLDLVRCFCPATTEG